MLLLGITDGPGNEVSQSSQPIILPPIEWQNFDGRRPQAVETDRCKHACSTTIEPIELAIAAILSPLPGQPGRRAGEPVEHNAVAGHDFLKKPLTQDVASLG